MEIGRPGGQQTIFASHPGEGQQLATIVGAAGDLDSFAAQVTELSKRMFISAQLRR